MSDFQNFAEQVINWAPGTIVELDGGTLDFGMVHDSSFMPRWIRKVPLLRGWYHRRYCPYRSLTFPASSS